MSLANSLVECACWPLRAQSLELLNCISKIEVQAYLKEVLNDSALMHWSAQRSYRHTLGFDKIVLAGTSGGARLRLHLWHKEEQSQDIHDHEWDYSSRVLYGSLFTREYKIGGPNHGHLLCKYSVQSGLNGLSRLTPIGEVFITGSEPSEVTAGSTHYLEAERYHSARCKEETLTLFLQGPRKGKTSTVLKPLRPERCIPETPVKHFDANELRKTIEHICMRLA